MNDIAAITTVRGDAHFLERWIEHYGSAFGRKSIYVVLDGHDQVKPANSDDVNFIYLPYQPLPRLHAMRRRARVMSHIATGLFHYHHAVIVTDVDEYLVVDPRLRTGLKEYLLAAPPRLTRSGLGLDVAQHTGVEVALDTKAPFLGQRRFAMVSDRYTKPVVAYRPVTWGSGMHRIKGANYHIDENLFLFHFGMADRGWADSQANTRDRVATGWGGHLAKRAGVFASIASAEPKDGDSIFSAVRRKLTWRRAPWAWNKPAPLWNAPVVRIPDRFFGAV